MDKIEQFAKYIIAHYHFSSNPLTGFSCYISDLDQLRNGFIIWVYSKHYNRFETHFQNLFSANRMNAIDQYKIDQAEYCNKMYDSVVSFIFELDKISGMKKIGKGINRTPGNKPKIYNRAIPFDFIKRNNHVLEDVEVLFTNNSLIEYICLLKQNLNIPLKTCKPSCYYKIFTQQNI